MTQQELVKQALDSGRGTFKLEAALGELLAAACMFDLWLYQSIKGKLSVYGSVVDSATRRHSEIVQSLSAAWAQFEGATEDTDDHLSASATMIPVLRSSAAELRAFLGGIDFYDDEALSPRM